MRSLLIRQCAQGKGPRRPGLFSQRLRHFRFDWIKTKTPSACFIAFPNRKSGPTFARNTPIAGMLLVIVALLAAIAPALAASSLPTAPGTVLFQDRFATMQSVWGVPDKQTFVQNGYLVLSAWPSQNRHAWLSSEYADDDFGVTLTQPASSGSPVSGGIDFWGDPEGNYYWFLLSNGTFAVGFSPNRGQGRRLISWTTSKAVKTGAADSNRLEVRQVRGVAYFLINDRLVGQVAIPQHGFHRIGLECDANPTETSNCSFSDFRVTVPATAPPSGATAPPSPPHPGTIILTDHFESMSSNWEPSDRYTTIKDGHLVIQVPPYGSGIDRLRGDYPGDDISVALTNSGGTSTSTIGEVDFWANPRDASYYWFIKSGSKFSVGQTWRAQNKTLIGPTESPALKTGEGAVNRLEVMQVGGTAYFLINGEVVGHFPIPGHALDGVGIQCRSDDKAPATCSFSDFRITAPPAAAPEVASVADTGPIEAAAASAPAPDRVPAAGTPTQGRAPGIGTAPKSPPAPGAILFEDRFTTLRPVWGKPVTGESAAAGHLELTQPADRARVLPFHANVAGDDIGVSIVMSSPAGGLTVGGLDFWWSPDRYYWFLERGGSFVVGTSPTKGGVQPLINWTASPALKTGDGAANRLEIRQVKGTAYFLINGQLVGHLAAPQDAGQYSGIECAASLKVQGICDFSDFTVTMPSAIAPEMPPGVTQAAGSTAQPASAPVSPSAPMAETSPQAPAPATAPISASQPSGAPGTVLFEDDFTNLSPRWSNRPATMSIRNGHLELTEPAGKVDAVSLSGAFAKSDISVKMAQTDTGGDSTAAGGIDFWWDKDGSSYWFDIGEGQFAVGSNPAQGQGRRLIDWTTTSALKTGEGAANRIEVTEIGDTAYFIINNEVVGRLAIPQHHGKFVGLECDADKKAPSTCAFSDFRVTVPATTPPAGPAPGAALFEDKFASLSSNWSGPPGELSVRNGQLLLPVPAGEVGSAGPSGSFPGDDIAVSLTQAGTAGTNADGGIDFWKDDNSNYAFIEGGGQFSVQKMDANGKGQMLIGWTATPALKTGDNVPNRLEIAEIGGTAYFIVNGQTVGHLAIPQHDGDAVGVECGADQKAPSTCAFGDFRVAVPPARPPAAAPAGNAPAASPPGTVLAEDRFTSLSPDWSGPGSQTYVKDGHFMLEADAGKFHFSRYRGDYPGDDVSVTLTQPGTMGTEADGGLEFWGGPDGYYWFLEGGGRFGVGRTEGGKDTTLLGWSPSEAIKTGDTDGNRLEIVQVKGTAYFLINGQVVGHLAIPPDAPDGIALECDADKSPSTCAFDDFRVIAPPAEAPGTAPAPAAAPPAAGQAAPAPAVPAAVGSPAPGTVLFEDNFATMQPAWGQPGAQVFAQDGHLVIKAKAGAVHYDTLQGDFIDDDISVALTQAGTTGTDASGGIQFWGSEKGNYWFDEGGGSFAVGSYDNASGKSLFLIDWTKSAALKTGDSASNRLEIDQVAGAAYFLINGQVVGHIAIPHHDGNQVSLECGAPDKTPSTCLFDDFRVTTPPLAPPAAKQTAVAASYPAPTVLMDDHFTTMAPVWGEPDAHVFVKDGHLVVKAPAGSKRLAVLDGEFAGDDISVALTQAGTTTTDAAAGVHFWLSEKGDYWFNEGGGSFAVGSYDAASDKSRVLIDWTATAALKTGDDASNRLEIAQVGGTAYFVINGQVVGHVAIPKHQGDQVALACYAADKTPSTCLFDDFRITTPPAAPPGTAQSAASPPPAPGTVLFEDRFSSLQAVWGQASDRIFTKDGHLWIEPTAGNYAFDRLTGDYGGADIRVDLTQATTFNGGAGGGLEFWTDANGFYWFIERAGQFAVAQAKTKGQGTMLIGWTSSPALKTGAGAANRLEIQQVKGTAYFLLNGQLVGHAAVPPGAGDGVGLICVAGPQAPSKCAFDDFRLAAAPAAPPGGPKAQAAVQASSAESSTAGLAAPATPPAPGTVLFEDKFTAPSQNWVSPAVVRDGHLELAVEAGHFNWVNPAGLYDGADVSVTLRQPGAMGSEAHGGIVFWIDGKTVYWFDIGNGYFAIGWRADGKGRTLIDWTRSSALRTGDDDGNQLEIQQVKGTAYFLVNGEVVGQLPIPQNAGKQVGLECGAGAKAASTCTFDDFRIAAPPAGPPPLPKPGTALFEDRFTVPSSDWPAPAVVKGGHLEIPVKADQSTWIGPAGSLGAGTDIGVTVTLPPTKGSIAAGGLAFWRTSDSKYLFLAGGGSFAVGYNGPKTGRTLIGWTTTPALKTDGTGNRLEIAQISGTAYFLINGAVVAHLPIPADAGSEAGLDCQADPKTATTCTFDDFRVAVPPEQPPKGTQPVAAAPAQPAAVAPAQPAASNASAPESAQPAASGASSAPRQAVGTPPAGPSSPAAVGPPNDLAAAGAPADAGAAGACPGKTIYADDFESVNPGWGQPGSGVAIGDGKFTMTAPASGIAGKFLTTLRLTNANLCVELEPGSADDPSAAAGLVFWATGVQSFDAFLVSPSGGFSVERHEGKKWLTLLPWTADPALKAAMKGPIPLRVALDGNVATVYAAGRKLGSVEGTPPTGGGYAGLISMASKAGAAQWQATSLVATAPDSP